MSVFLKQYRLFFLFFVNILIFGIQSPRFGYAVLGKLLRKFVLFIQLTCKVSVSIANEVMKLFFKSF